MKLIIVLQFVFIPFILHGIQGNPLYTQLEENLNKLYNNITKIVEISTTSKVSETTVEKRTDNYNYGMNHSELLRLYESKLAEKNNKNLHDFERRLFLSNIYRDQEKIISYEILHYRTLARSDNGFFTNFLVILVFKNKVKLYDIYNNLIAEQSFEFELNDAIVIHTNEDLYFYLLTNSKTVIRKYKFSMLKFDKRMDEELNEGEESNGASTTLHKNKLSFSQEGDKITIRTFKENINAYDITFQYRKNMNKYSWLIEEISNFSTNSTEVYVNNVITSMKKGKKLISLVLSNLNIVNLDENLKYVNSFDSKTNSKLESHKNTIENFQIYQSFTSFASRNKIDNEDSIILSNIDNFNNTILNCSISNYTKNTKINNYIFDSFTYLLYVLLDNGNIIFISPHIVYNNNNYKDNFCSVVKTIQLGINFDTGLARMEILRKDLVIFKTDQILQEDKLISIDLNDVEFMNENINRDISFSVVNLKDLKDPFQEISGGTNNNNKFVASKGNNYYYLLVSRNDYSLLFLELILPNNRLKGTEEFSFNFKIPIILVALLILFFYHYFKNRNNTKNEYEKDKDDLMEKLKNFGAFESNKNNTKKNPQRPNFNQNKKEEKEDEEEESEEETISDDDEMEEKVKEFLKNKKTTKFS